MVQGTEVDYPGAVKYFMQAAEHGHSLAQYQLATLYAEGRGVDCDEEKVFHLSLLESL